MIDVKELRVGNLVFRTELSKTLHSKISAYTLSCAGHDGIIDFLSPIPITPEILEKAGFDNYDNFNNCDVEFYRLNGVELQLLMRKDEFPVYVYRDNATKEQKTILIKSLHQLQNLFYCLTGEELNIEL